MRAQGFLTQIVRPRGAFCYRAKAHNCRQKTLFFAHLKQNDILVLQRRADDCILFETLSDHPTITSRAGRHSAYRGIFLAAGLAHGPQARYTAARFVAAGRLMFCGMALREPDTGVCRPCTCGGLGGFYRVAFQHASRLFSNFCLATWPVPPRPHTCFS